MRACLYARYSDEEKQSSRSIIDQFRIAEELCARNGWQIVQRYHDDGISGAAMVNRPGFLALMRDVEAGLYDRLVGEALDRFSRSLEHTARTYNLCEHHGCKIVTLAEGEVTPMHVGMAGTMNQLALVHLAQKTHRGLEGRALAGRPTGGKSYGLRTHYSTAPNGERIVGDRYVYEPEAAVVRRIFSEVKAGRSPKRVCHSLNAEGIPCPSGGTWGPSTLTGNRQRGTGILNNEAYIGIFHWNKLKYSKNPKTGKKIPRLNPRSEWITTVDESLRIVDDATWLAVRRLYAKLDERGPFNKKVRPVHILSGLLACGSCGGSFSIVNSRRYGCSTARNKGTCSNRLTISRELVESKVISALQTRLMDQTRLRVFCAEYTAHVNRVRHERNAERAKYEIEMARTQRAIDKIVDAIAEGSIVVALIKDKANALQARKEELITLLATKVEAPVFVHPTMAERYALSIENLIQSLQQPAQKEEAANIMRQLITKIVFSENEDGSALVVDLIGDLAGILQISEKHAGKILIKPKVALSKAQAAELEQIQEIISSSPTGFAGSAVQVVAGARFELTTFRL